MDLTFREAINAVALGLISGHQLPDVATTGLAIADRIDAARSLVRTYARLVSVGELTPRLGAARIIDVHLRTQRSGCDAEFAGDCIGAARIIGLFNAHDDCGFLDETAHDQIDVEIRDHCRAIASEPAV
jgi:hypothetical protein